MFLVMIMKYILCSSSDSSITEYSFGNVCPSGFCVSDATAQQQSLHSTMPTCDDLICVLQEFLWDFAPLCS